jgi:2-desacetyl-2-hydroxyethyl bacteriochlorophyllide A dehydrogenase
MSRATRSVPETMRAAVLVAPDTFEVRDTPVPAPGPEDVLVRVEACAVCSSDVSLIHSPWPGQPPFGSFIPGHEYAGTVVAVGATVNEVAVGDRIAVEAHFGCTRCVNCRLGNYTACLNWGQPGMGHRANGMTTNGGFAQFVVNHVSTVHRIPDGTSFDEASLLTNLGCVLYGFEIMGGYLIGDRIVVIGEGPLGLISVQVARLLGADEVVLVGMDERRLALGKTMGADRIIDARREDPVSALKPAVNRGVDVAIEASGSRTGLKWAALLPKWMGKVLLLGIPEGQADIDFHDFARGNKYLYTVRGEGWTNCRRGASLLRQGRVNLGPLVTHRFALDNVEEAFRTHVERRENAIKVVVQPNAR